MGKVGTDEFDLALKLDEDTYIITKLLPIPIIK
jgi:hypothetical protein